MGKKDNDKPSNGGDKQPSTKEDSDAKADEELGHFMLDMLTSSETESKWTPPAGWEDAKNTAEEERAAEREHVKKLAQEAGIKTVDGGTFRAKKS